MWSMEASELSRTGPCFLSTAPLNFTKFSCSFPHSYLFNSIFHTDGSKSQLVLQQKCLKASHACLTAATRVHFLTPPNDLIVNNTSVGLEGSQASALVCRYNLTLQKQRPSYSKLLPTWPESRWDFFCTWIKAHDEDAREWWDEEPCQVRPGPTLLFVAARGTQAS